MLYSPVGLRLVDDFTGRPPIGRIRAHLDSQTAGGWETTDVKAVRTPGNVISYPGLGRSANFAVQPPMHCRVRIEAEFYTPDYLLTRDGFEFDAHPYDDDNPPAATATLPNSTFMLPAANYPYEGHLRVLRGQVADAANAPVANVEVSLGVSERAASDQRGRFALPLRWAPLSGPIQIDAIDQRTGRNGQKTVTLPGDLASGHVIVIS